MTEVSLVAFAASKGSVVAKKVVDETGTMKEAAENPLGFRNAIADHPTTIASIMLTCRQYRNPYQPGNMECCKDGEA